MKPDTLRAFMAREYPELEVDPLWITSIYGIKIAELSRSSRGNLTGVRAWGGSAFAEPTTDNLRTAIEQGLRAQSRSHCEIAATLESICKALP